MREEWTNIVLSVLCVTFCSNISLTRASDVKHYTNKWLVHVPLGNIAARMVAQNNNMEFNGPDAGNEGFYQMIKTDIPDKLLNHQEETTIQLNNHELVTTAIQEAVKARSHRGSVPRHVVPRYVGSVNLQEKSNYADAFDDEQWPEMWYFQDYRTDANQPVLDMNIVPVWLKLGITGENVNITVPDDGLEWSHPEILPKFNSDLSWNYISNNYDIMPDKDGRGSYRSHGTRCAGEIIMQPDNGICGVGTAYGASIGGIKFLDDESTDAREAKVLHYAYRYVSIYSNSWGPADTGTIMGTLTEIVQDSLSKGIHRGRDGKGVIYVFAAGNGKTEFDNCACDGFVNSIYTAVIASCDDSGHVTHYSERCASILATAYSGSGLEKNVLTTDVRGTCTDTHTGTSAAAPLVSGIIALALSANSDLTWRDVHHLIAWTSQVAPLSDNYGWNRNKAGFYYSVDFGFGLVNAYKLVLQAKVWENVPEMASCAILMPGVEEYPVTRDRAARIIVKSDGCEGLTGEINYIESVQLVVTMTYPKRGDIQIAMRSPLGTECHVLESRKLDISNQGLKKWTFSVLAFWGESPKGDFIIDIFDTTGPKTNEGYIKKMTLSINGTKDPPQIYENGPRSYDYFTLPKQGDNPRFLNLSSIKTKSLRNSSQNKKPISSINNVNEVQYAIRLKQRVEDIQNIMKQNLQNVLTQLAQEENEENAILQNVMMF